MEPGDKAKRPRADLYLDMDELAKPLDRAARRASAFVFLGLDGIEGRIKGDFNLTNDAKLTFWPPKVSEAVRLAVNSEYVAWHLGNVLADLDAQFSLFLDKVWWWAEVGDLHGTAVPSDYVIGGKFHTKTNSSAKYEILGRKISLPDHGARLTSLSLARNSLMHNGGVVRSPRDCNDAARTSLEISWLAPVIAVGRGDVLLEIGEEPIDTTTLPGKGEVGVYLQIKEKVAEFRAGQRIVLSKDAIAQMCFFYKIAGGQVIKSLGGYLAQKGVVTAIKPDTTSGPA